MMLKTGAQWNHLVNPAAQLVRALQMLGLGGVRGLALGPATAVVSWAQTSYLRVFLLCFRLMSAKQKPCTVPSKGWTVFSTWPPTECLVLSR